MMKRPRQILGILIIPLLMLFPIRSTGADCDEVTIRISGPVASSYCDDFLGELITPLPLADIPFIGSIDASRLDLDASQTTPSEPDSSDEHGILKTTQFHEDGFDFETIEDEHEVLDSSLRMDNSKRYRLRNIAVSDNMTISLKGNIKIRLLEGPWRQLIDLDRSDLYIKIEDQGTESRLIYKQRF